MGRIAREYQVSEEVCAAPDTDRTEFFSHILENLRYSQTPVPHSTVHTQNPIDSDDRETPAEMFLAKLREINKNKRPYGGAQSTLIYQSSADLLWLL